MNLFILTKCGCPIWRQYYSDYDCYIVGANYKEALKFLNNANSIMQQLDKIETKQVEEVNKALADTEWIVKAS